MKVLEIQNRQNELIVPADSRQFPRAIFGREIDALTAIYQSVGVPEAQARRAALADLQADFGYVALAA